MCLATLLSRQLFNNLILKLDSPYSSAFNTSMKAD